MEHLKIAVFPGSFDPITIGHESIILRALPLFDEIIVAIGKNSDKRSLFSMEDRKLFISELFKGEKKVKVDTFDSLTVNYCKSLGASYILRGLRTSADFEYERMVALANKTLEPNLETIFLLTDTKHSYINSSLVRDILHHGGNPSEFVPKTVCELIISTKEK